MSRGLRLQDTAFLGRVGNAGVTPLSFPGLLRWYKADSYTGIANDGEGVGGGLNPHGPWIDQTGSGDDGVGSGVFNTNQIGTQPLIHMPGTQFAFVPGILNDFTIIYVGFASGATNSMEFYNAVTGHQLRNQFLGVHANVFYAGGAVITSSGLGPTGVLEALVTRRSAGVITFFQNKISEGGGIEATPWEVTSMGTSTGFGGDERFAEIMIYNTVISDANLDLLYDQYLKPKWVTLP